MLVALSAICESPKMITFQSRGIERSKLKFQEYLKDLMNKLQSVCLGSIRKDSCSLQRVLTFAKV